MTERHCDRPVVLERRPGRESKEGRYPAGHDNWLTPVHSRPPLVGTEWTGRTVS